MQQEKNSYRERVQLMNLLTRQMEKRDWNNAIQSADELLQAGIQEREMFHAVLAA